MYLKTLTLKGFKSFCDRTRLSFDPGLTVVVGPNGSGKSNVSDAILWVLGGQSAKALRGQAMEDVVFAGSAQRQPVSVAEVTLVLDNADRAIPLDFSEIAITRRMYRSGESDYLMNGAPVRLRDVRDLLHDMGLGRDTHSIISQGRLGEVLQSRPEERRELIEEAAGIAKFRQRKERAERKLKRLEEDIRRIRDYTRLLKRELRPLEKQVSQVRALNELEERQASIETILAVDDVRQLQARWNRIAQASAEAEATAELAAYRLREKEQELAQVKRLLEEKGLFAGDLEAQRHRSQQVLQRASSALTLLEEKERHGVDKRSESRRQLLSCDRELETITQELEQNQGQLSAVESEHERASAALSRLTPQEAESRAASKRDAKALEQARRETQRAHRRVNEATLAHAKLSQKLQSATLTQELFDDRLKEVKANEAAAQEAREEQEAALNQLEELEKEANERTAFVKQRVSNLRRERDEAKERRSHAEASLFEATTEKTTLERLSHKERKAQSCQELVARAMRAQGLKPTQLVENLQFPHELQGALATYLGEDLFGFLCSSSHEQRELAQQAGSSGGSGRASLIAPVKEGESALEASQEQSEELRPLLVDEQTPASDASVKAVLRRLFLGVYRVHSVQEGLTLAERHPSARAFLGKDGSVVLSDGRVRIGKPAAESTQALERAERLRELERSIPRLTQELNEATAHLDEAERALGQEREKERVLAQELAGISARSKAAQRELGRASEVSQRALRERAKLERQQEEALRDISADRTRLDELAQELNDAHAHLSSCQERVPALDEAAQRSLATANDLKDELTSKQLAATRLAEQTRSLNASVASLKRRSQNLRDQRQTLTKSIAALEVLGERVEPLRSSLEALHEVALQRATVLRDRSSLAEADSATLKKTVRAAEVEVETAQQAVMDSSAELAQKKADAKVVKESVRQATQRLKDLHTLELEEALELEAPQDRGSLERELEEILLRIDELGPVNRAALSQYETGKERLEAVQSELADLTGARDALTKISRAIERKMRQRFVETFAEVNKHFSEVFQTLFAGGTARLEMVDPAHPDETGIEVRAQPPRKRIAKMTLLSGGERSLTALALLFAVYQTRTVPFYVFDEVEQALDDTNLDKLLQSLTTLKQQTQLIVISHQRRTMEQADVLYGVSMGADGVSRALSQRLSDFKPVESKADSTGKDHQRETS